MIARLHQLASRWLRRSAGMRAQLDSECSRASILADDLAHERLVIQAYSERVAELEAKLADTERQRASAVRALDAERLLSTELEATLTAERAALDDDLLTAELSASVHWLGLWDAYLSLDGSLVVHGYGMEERVPFARAGSITDQVAVLRELLRQIAAELKARHDGDRGGDGHPEDEVTP